MRPSLNLALDYDNTYSADPEFFDEFVALAEKYGHTVYVVTCRRNTTENQQECAVPNIPWGRHFFTSLASKRWFCEQRGVKIDIWIDDHPETIKEGI